MYREDGALLIQGEDKEKFEKCRCGDIIGMILDVDVGRHSRNAGVLVFMLNAAVQGACSVPKKPLFISVLLYGGDRTKLRRRPLEEAPSEAIQALSGPLIGLA